MPGQLLTLNARAEFATGLRGFIEEKADRRERALNAAWAAGHVAALRTFANYVHSLDGVRDRHLVILCDVNASISRVLRAGGEEAREFEFRPTLAQNRILETLADTKSEAVPDSEETLRELCACGVRDMANAHQGQSEGVAREKISAREEVQAAKNDAAGARAAAERAAGAAAEVEELRDQLAEKDELLQELGNPDTSRPRRVKVDGLVGIYISHVDGVEVYEVNWTEAGKARWKRIGPDLTEARRARAQLSGEPIQEMPESSRSDDLDSTYEAALGAKAQELGREPNGDEAAALYDELAKSNAAAKVAEEVI